MVNREKLNQVIKILFSKRLLTVVERDIRAGEVSINLRTALEYEMSSIPLSLFDPDKHLMNEADKPSLANSIYKMVKESPGKLTVPSNVKYVLDGGNLLYQVPWKKFSVFNFSPPSLSHTISTLQVLLMRKYYSHTIYMLYHLKIIFQTSGTLNYWSLTEKRSCVITETMYQLYLIATEKHLRKTALIFEEIQRLVRKVLLLFCIILFQPYSIL